MILKRRTRKSGGADAPRPPQLIGRQAEYDRFAECMTRARRGRPTVLLFEGEPGSGKTSLLAALIASRLVVGRNVIALRMEAAATPGLDVVTRAVEMITRPELFAAVGGRRRAGEIARKLLPEWISAIPVLGAMLSAVIVTTQAVTKRRKTAPQRAMAEDIATLQRLAHGRPIALMVDDLHLLSPAATDRLLRLLRTAENGTRLLVAATVGTPAPSAARSVARVMAEGLPAESVLRHQLTPFSPDELDLWLDARFAADIPREVSTFLLAETGGQPAAILSLLERLLESGALRRGDHGWEYDAAVGEAQFDASDAAEAYLGGLAGQTADLLRSASVLGDEFDAMALARLVDLDELELEDRLAVAVRRGLVSIAGETALTDGEISTRYRFASTTGRAALLRTLSADRRRELEARVAAT